MEPLTSNHDWELRCSFKKTSTSTGNRVFSFSTNPLSNTGYIEILENANLVLLNENTALVDNITTQNPAGNFVQDTHYYMSMYYDVSAQSLKICYETSAEFTNWESLRDITTGNTTTHDLSAGPPTGILSYTMYIGNTARNYDRPLVGWVDLLGSLCIRNSLDLLKLVLQESLNKIHDNMFRTRTAPARLF